jgi:UDP-N-acetylglucosamine diphosphorylase/glucosamine-1-phosphate N-acetyltransferase
MEGVTLNTTDGPIFIDEGATIMEGSFLRGPLYVGKNSVIKMGTKIYANCSFGPSVKVGGEINNVVFFGNSNKGHDGFLGNAVIGEWCNIGAGTDASNLKNDYGLVRVWDYASGNFAKTDLQFCGLLMGDHSQCAIQTTFNTATVVGIGCNLFGHGFPRQFIPSFSRGGSQGFSENRLYKVIETAKAMKKRRGVDFTPADHDHLQDIFQKTASFRN